MATSPTMAFVGARQEKLEQIREKNPEWVELYTRAAAYCACRGCLVTTGAGTGSDQLAAETALRAGGRVKLFLPWAGWESDWVQRMQQEHGKRVALHVYNRHGGMESWWEQRIAFCHAAPEHVQPRDVPLLTRTGGILWEASAVVALPLWEQGRAGGTEYALRVAQSLLRERSQFPMRAIYDLTKPGAREWWAQKLGGK